MPKKQWWQLAAKNREKEKTSFGLFGGKEGKIVKIPNESKRKKITKPQSLDPAEKRRRRIEKRKKRREAGW